jgi:hypothetical protein
MESFYVDLLLWCIFGALMLIAYVLGRIATALERK